MMNCRERACLTNTVAIGFILVVLLLALLVSGCDDRRCRDHDLNEFQRMACQ